MFQLGDGRGWSGVAIDEDKYSCQFLPRRDEGITNHAGMGGAGGVPCRRRYGDVDDTDLGMCLIECDWLGWIVWLVGSPWTPPPEITVYFYVV